MEKSQKLKSKNQNCNSKVKSYFRYFLLFTFTFAFCLLPFNFAFAAEYKVYSSEAIGAGDKVYHIESCLKTPSYGPLYCNEETKDVASRQCEPEGKLLKIPIKGCNKGTFIPPGNIYPKVDIGRYERKKDQTPPGCADDPENQRFFYAPEFAVVGSTSDEIKGTVVWGTADQNADPSALIETIPQSLIDQIESGGVAKPLYRPTLCTKWDVPAENNDDLNPEDPAGLEGKVLELYTNARGGGTELIEAGCNNDNTSQAIRDVEQSTPFDDKKTYTCTIYERITGASGSDLLGQYISALYRWAAGIVGIVAVLIMTYSGIQISMAGGDTAKLDSAKNRIMQSIIGLAILFLSGLILYTINPGFFTG